MLIHNISFLVTQNAARDILEDISLRVIGDRIVEIGELLPQAHEEVIDAKGCIVLSGLINTHTHIGMNLLRGYSDDKELHEWLKDVIAQENRQTPQDVYDGALLACKESLLFGTTTLFDMYTPAEHCAKAAADSGIRAIICPAFFDAFMDTKKELALDNLWQKTYDSHPRIQLGYGPHSIYGCSAELIKRISAHAKTHKKLVMIHLAETRKERYDCHKQYGKLPLEYLDSLGVLGPHMCLVHSVWLTKEEIRTIAKSGAKCIHCPTSNMKLASGGSFALRQMQDAGVVVGLGTDSTASNNSLDMFSEMKICALLHKHQYWDPTMANAQTVLDMATIHGAKVMGMEKEIGSLEVGKKADIVMIPLREHMQPCSKERVVSHLVYAINGSDVDTVLVDGKVVVKNRRFING